jgi:isopentenyl-diphosphate delta-isomerase
MRNQTESRKKEHVDLVISKGAQYRKTNGLERFEFIHDALPEISLGSVDLSCDFLQKKLKWPIMITAITGGYKDAAQINESLALVAEKYGLAFGVGSQRAMVEKPELAYTYQVRKVAPTIPLVANIGAYQLKKYPFEKIETIVSKIEADALAVHLNPLQEVVQPEGDTDYSSVIDAISRTCERMPVPVIAKETGAGISQDAALKLKAAGVKYIDVAGAGGTSWSSVEYLRDGVVPGFGEWGIPTAESIIQCRGVLPLIASGGLRSGIDCAKAITLGANLAGAAYPFLMAWHENRLEKFASMLTMQMKICAYLTGSSTLAELKKAKMRFI